MKTLQYALFFLSTTISFGSEILTLTVPSDEEILFLNRIADFWEEGEYLIAKNQIQEFITLYPKSHFADTLHAAMGEIFFQENSYGKALDAYAKIQDPQIASSVFLHRIECLYHLQWYPILVEECEANIEQSGNAVPFYLAMGLYQQCALMLPKIEHSHPLLEKAKSAFANILAQDHPIEIDVAWAHLCWMMGDMEKAANTYLSLVAQNPHNMDIYTEAALMQLEKIRFFYEQREWENCKTESAIFFAQFPKHPNTSSAIEFLLSAATQLASQGSDEKKELIADLEKYLPFLEKQTQYHILLAKTYIALGEFEKGLSILEPLQKQLDLSEKEGAEITFLTAIALRDGFHDVKQFCLNLEKGKQEILANEILSPVDFHATLYNAYLELEDFENAEEHLFFLFGAKNTTEESLLWLANRYFEKRHLSEEIRDRAIAILETLTPRDATIVPLSHLYLEVGQKEQAISLLEKSHSPDAKLLLAQQCEDNTKALLLFEEICKAPMSLRTWAGASACLESAKIQIASWGNDTALSNEDIQVQQVLAQLKNMVLQKTIAHEPLYLEAALEYLDVQSRCNPSPFKKTALLTKIIHDFETKEDLLSKDYHKAKENLLEKSRIHHSYLQFLYATLYLTQKSQEKDAAIQKQLQAKAKDLLLKVIEERVSPALVARAEQCLDR